MKSERINNYFLRMIDVISNSGNDDFQDLINKEFIEMISILEVDHGAIFRYDFHEDKLHCISTSSHDVKLTSSRGISELPDQLLSDHLNEVNYLVPYHALESTLSISKDTQTSLTVPIFLQDECFGFYKFDWNKSITISNSFYTSMNRLMKTHSIYLLKDKIFTVLLNLQSEIKEITRENNKLLEKVTHELRTPLNGITSSLEIVKDKDVDGLFSEQVEIIDYCANALLNEINNVVSSNDEQFILSSEGTIVDFEDEIIKLIDFQKYYAGYHNTEIEFDYCYKIPKHVHIDIKKIRKIITGLLEGAIKNTEEGNVKLSIETKKIQTPYLSVVFKVEYEGDFFITNEDFVSYYDVEVTEKPRYIDFKYKLIKDYINLLRGSLEIDERDNNKVYEFELKLYIPKFEEVSRVKKPEFMFNNTSNNLSTSDLHVLVVDDNRINRRVLKSLLKREGLFSDEASSGFEAIKIVKEVKYDIIFMDILMPGLDGFETAKQIRYSNNLNTNTPIIVVSANDEEKTRANLIDAGMNGFIPKPLNSEKIKDVLKYYLKQSDNDYILENDFSIASFNIKKFTAVYKDINFRIDILETFLEDFESDKQDVLEAYESKDIENVKKVILYMKGTFKYLNAEKLALLTDDIIKNCKLEDFEKIESSQIVFMDYFDKLYKEVNDYFITLK